MISFAPQRQGTDNAQGPMASLFACGRQPEQVV